MSRTVRVLVGVILLGAGCAVLLTTTPVFVMAFNPGSDKTLSQCALDRHGNIRDYAMVSVGVGIGEISAVIRELRA